MPITDDDTYEIYRERAALLGPWPQHGGIDRNGDLARNAMRRRIDALPLWMRAIEEMAWTAGCPGGGS